MGKTKILGIANRGEFNYIMVRKNKDFFSWLRKVMYNSFEGVPDLGVKEWTDKEGNLNTQKKKIDKCVDEHESHECGDETKIDIFYGKEKVFIIVITSLQKRKKLMNNLDKYSEFLEYTGEDPKF